MVTTHTQPDMNEHTKAAKRFSKEPSGELSRVACSPLWPPYCMARLRAAEFSGCDNTLGKEHVVCYPTPPTPALRSTNLGFNSSSVTEIR